MEVVEGTKVWNWLSSISTTNVIWKKKQTIFIRQGLFFWSEVSTVAEGKAPVESLKYAEVFG